MTITWNSDADYKFITSLVAAAGNALDWEKVAELMGNDCSVGALKHRVTRLKAKVKATEAAGNSPGSNSKPSKSKAPKTKPRKHANYDTEVTEDDANATAEGEYSSH